MRIEKICCIGMMLCLLCSCVVGPNYRKPCVMKPTQFKEAPKGWKIAQPNDGCERGAWWTIFHDAELNALEARVNISNQTIAQAEAQFRQALALIDEARASYFPTLATSLAITRQKSASFSSGTTLSDSGAGTSTVSNVANTTPFTNQQLLLNALWEPDLWGSVRRTVEANAASAQATAAQLALTRLSSQASLAQFYFELRGLDASQQLLNETVAADKKILQLTKNQYASGVVGRADVIQAQSQLETAEALAINNGLNRAIYEHAIAVLIGVPPSCFSIRPRLVYLDPPVIPLEIPCVLLERRPDVAQAERLMAQANAQIGIAIAAFYPSLTLNGQGSLFGVGGIGRWLTEPGMGWALGGQLIETIFDGGLRSATVCAARANYKATVAGYRQIVLTAFQEVEDNLSSTRILKAQGIVLDKAAADARAALRIVTNQYKAGTVAYSNVLLAQNAAYTAEKNALDTRYLRMTSAVGLIKALGGGWKACSINGPVQLTVCSD